MTAAAIKATAGMLGALAVATAGPESWEQRLEALNPSDPVAYFELAEEVADTARDQNQRDLARHLFSLAGAIEPPRLGRSACLALADLEPNEHARSRLLALAVLLDRGEAAFGTDPLARPASIDRVAALAVSESLGYYRNGNGSRALNAIETPWAMDLLDRYGAVVFRGGSRRFVEDCRLYRGGARRPMVTDHDLTMMLRFEAALLAGDNRTWAGDLLLTRGRPLIEVDPGRIQDTLSVDVTRACYRSGRWVECP